MSGTATCIGVIGTTKISYQNNISISININRNKVNINYAYNKYNIKTIIGNNNNIVKYKQKDIYVINNVKQLKKIKIQQYDIYVQQYNYLPKNIVVNGQDNNIYHYLKLKSDIKQISIIEQINKLDIHKSKLNLCISNNHKIFNYNFNKKSIYINNEYNNIFIIKECKFLCKNNISTKTNANIIINPCNFNVSDYKPPDFDTGSNAGGISSFKIIVQKQSYYEQALSFTDSGVKTIMGLPQGMIYELGYLKGSPIVSGDYPITITLENNNKLKGLLVVTQLPRIL